MWWLFTRKLLFNENSGKKKLLFAFTGGFITRGSLFVFFPSCVTLFIKKCAGKTWNSGEQQMVPIVRQHPEDIETCFQKV